jgi:hypothetical protein
MRTCQDRANHVYESQTSPTRHHPQKGTLKAYRLKGGGIRPGTVNLKVSRIPIDCAMDPWALSDPYGDAPKAGGADRTTGGPALWSQRLRRLLLDRAWPDPSAAARPTNALLDYGDWVRRTEASKSACATRVDSKKAKNPQTLQMRVHYETPVPPRSGPPHPPLGSNARRFNRKAGSFVSTVPPRCLIFFCLPPHAISRPGRVPFVVTRPQELCPRRLENLKINACVWQLVKKPENAKFWHACL